jgi:two-component system phosphate regulon sensor histidine kinase PhoR
VINFENEDSEIFYNVDVFHFENALNNVIDNAVKYGGNTIDVSVRKKDHSVEINIHDNGNSLSEQHKKNIFEKFYRVPKGNTHDVKGFGIGLYYTRKIVEKHDGKIELDLKQGTNFKIVLPNEQ